MKSRMRAWKVKIDAIATKTAGPGSHQRSPEAAREPHHDEERDADREELGGQRRPVLEDPVEVAEVALAPPPLPPVGGDRERKVDEPGEAQTEHPEEHPGADRSRRGLPHEFRAAARVEPQRRESAICASTQSTVKNRS